MSRKFGKKKRSTFKTAFIVLFMLILIPTAFFFISPKTFDSIVKRVENFIAFPLKKQPESVVPVVEEEPIVAIKPAGVLQKDVLATHQFAARRFGVAVIKNEAALEKLIATNKLLVVEGGIGYTLEDMTHSYPYLTPNAKRALERIGISFYEYSKDNSTVTVTSLTRTEDTQKKLRRSNRNATQEESTHTRGVSFDISYIRYNGIKDWNDKHTKVLEGVLAAMQANDEIYVIKERNQSCFHVTVRK